MFREGLVVRDCGIPGLEAGDGWGESLGLRRLCRRRLRPGPDRPSAAGASAQRDHRCGCCDLESRRCLGLTVLPRSVNRAAEMRTPVVGTRLAEGFLGPDTLLYSVPPGATTWSGHALAARYSIDWWYSLGMTEPSGTHVLQKGTHGRWPQLRTAAPRSSRRRMPSLA